MNGGEKILNAAQTDGIKRELSRSYTDIQMVQPQLQAYAQPQNIVNAQDSHYGGTNITVYNTNEIHVDGKEPEGFEEAMDRVINTGLVQKLEALLEKMADNERRSAYA